MVSVMIVVRSSIGSWSSNYLGSRRPVAIWDQGSVLCRSQCRFRGWLRAGRLRAREDRRDIAICVRNGGCATCGGVLLVGLMLGIAVVVGVNGRSR